MSVTEQVAPAAPKQSVLDFLFGRPLASDEDSGETVGAAAGVGTFGLDAPSSAAYGPEAALTILIPLGMAGVAYIVPISFTIILLLGILYFSYLQTIAAYPNGGGSYTVASENLGPRAGVLAAAALMIDYVLDVAVGISAGVGALISAVPSLQPHTLAICLAILAILTLINLRGTREAGVVFMVPTYIFVACLGAVVAIGFYKMVVSGGHPASVVAPPQLPAASAALGWWLLLKAFSGGCTAMTGVEAVSNGVQAFREPRIKEARISLTLIVGILAALLAGIALLIRAYHIGATAPGQLGYQTTLSQLTAAVAGRNVFYFVTIGSILLVLALSANTAFAGFPRLCRIVAEERIPALSLHHSWPPSGVFLRNLRAGIPGCGVAHPVSAASPTASSRYSPSARSWPSPCRRREWWCIGNGPAEAAPRAACC